MIRKIIRQLLGQTVINYLGYILWLSKKRSGGVVLPSFLKHRVVKKYAEAFGIKTFIETGTFHGDMLNATKNIFDGIISIEFSNDLSYKAQKRFVNDKKISIFCGDSAILLPQIIQNIKEPCIFWLDAHCGHAAKETPIIEELETVFKHSKESKINHVVLIDDARLYNGQGDWPSISELKKISFDYKYSFTIKDDIIIIHK